MAINPGSSYPGNIDVTSDPTGYPYGKAQNISAPSAGDGTPWEELIINDFLGFQQALLAAAAIIPSGTPDKVGASQYLAALQTIFEAAFSKNTAFNLNFGINSGDIAEIASALAVSSIVETNASGKLITATKNTGYNKNVGTTAGTVAAGDDSRFAGITAALKTSDFIHVRDEKASGTNGGTFASGSYLQRNLNTVVDNTIVGASLSANQVTLPAGDYIAFGYAPAYDVGFHKARLYDTTAAAAIALGRNSFASGATAVTESQVISNVFTLAGVSVLELQHQCQITSPVGQGFGLACTFGDNEVYAELVIFKL